MESWSVCFHKKHLPKKVDKSVIEREIQKC